MSSKLENFGLLLLCFLYFPFKGKVNKTPSNPKNIVIFRNKAYMGDMVCMTPMFRAVKNKYPDSKLIFIGGGRAEEVVRYNPDIDEYIKYTSNFWTIVKKLRAEKVDFACMVNQSSSLGFTLLYVGGAKCISLFEQDKSAIKSWSSYNILKKMAIQRPLYRGMYLPSQFMTLLEPINTDNTDVSFHLYFSEESRNAVRNILSKNNVIENSFVVAIAPGGSTEDRWWSAEKFAKIADWLSQKYDAKIFLVGAGKDEKAIRNVISCLNKETQYVNLLNQSFDEFKAFISKCTLVIGNDSGPMVTADAFKVANLVIVGPTDARENHLPPSKLNRIAKMPSGNVRDITLEYVREELHIILKNLNVQK